MTLKGRFIKQLYSPNKELNSDYIQAWHCEQIADDYAIEFAKFIANEDYDLDYWVNNSDIKILLEIFKKEKGL